MLGNLFYYEIHFGLIKSVEKRSSVILIDDHCFPEDTEDEKTPIHTSLGARIRYLRLKNNLSQQTLASKSGTAVSGISNYEKDRIRNPNIRVTEKIAKALKMRVRELFMPDEPSSDLYDRLCPPTTLGKRIKNFRIRHNIRQKELAKQLGIHNVTLCRYENDVTKPGGWITKKIKDLPGAPHKNRGCDDVK